MKCILPLLTFGLASLAGTANALYLEYYPDHACATTSVSATRLLSPSLGCSACVNLASAAKSFHVGAPVSEKQVPANCEIIGYADKGCRGSINVQIQGPSKEDKCYATGVNMGVVASVESVRLLCS